MKVGIIGAGAIAAKMANTLSLMDKNDAQGYAIASRSMEKAAAFAQCWGMEKAYGSYRELVEDPAVDLVYVATPHSHHYDCARLAVEAGKPVLCEKAFTANAAQAGALIALAEDKGVFITEAMYIRYNPLSLKIRELIDSGAIGRPQMLDASLCYHMVGKARLFDPALCGGALLDVGVYPINMARMCFGTDIRKISSSCVLSDTGVDTQNAVSFVFADGKVANLQSSSLFNCDRRAFIGGDEGYIVVDQTGNPHDIYLYDSRHELKAHFSSPSTQLTGYEYEILACRDALASGLLESPFMPHDETLEVMRLMDGLRNDWGVVYPMDL